VSAPRIRVLRYRLPFRSPLAAAGREIETREGVLVEIGAGGLHGLGEASPAWWVGGETLGEVEHSLATVLATPAAVIDAAARLAGPAGRVGGDHSAPIARRVLRDMVYAYCGGLVPSVRCALETALLDLTARRQTQPLYRLLHRPSGHAGGGPPRGWSDVPVSHLLTGPSPSLVSRRAADAMTSGARTVKLKVGGRSPDEDGARIRAVLGAVGPDARLRLDANRAWSLTKAISTLSGLDDPRIEMVEEPLAGSDLRALASLRRRCDVPIALDESIRDTDDVTRAAAAHACDVVVVKLAAVGGPLAAVELAGHARSLGLGVVFTDSLETIVGQSATAHAAAAMPPVAAVGLGGATTLEGPAARMPGGAPGHVRVRGPGLGLGLGPEGVLAGGAAGA